jgi:hypothetical protein
MVKKSVNRNGRGQIVSYELAPNEYGEVLLSTTNFQNVEKYEISSFRANVDSEIVEFNQNRFVLSDFAVPAANAISFNISIDPVIDLGFIANIDYTGVNSNDQSNNNNNTQNNDNGNGGS